jgi:prepilin-type N-terminal cleavage/methylation domain-containing protein
MKFIKKIASIDSAGLLQNNRGFTLIEAVVVLSIVSIVIGMAYSSFRTPDEKLACRHIFSNLQLAKMQAVSVSAEQTVDINTTVNDLVDVTLNTDYQFLTTQPTYEPLGMPWDTDGINFGGDDEIKFTPKGVPDSQGIVYVNSVDNPERQCAVTVSLGGMVKMWTSNDNGASFCCA